MKLVNMLCMVLAITCVDVSISAILIRPQSNHNDNVTKIVQHRWSGSVPTVSSQPFKQLRIVLTAALTSAYYEFRKQQYIECFAILREYGYLNPYVIEAVKKSGPTFLDNYSNNVFYATCNNTHLLSPGNNEGRTLLEGLRHFNFDSDDMIVKLTGRYQFFSDEFLRLIQNNPTYDAFIKVDHNPNVYTLCFAMRCKYMQEMYEGIDYAGLNYYSIPVENAVMNYIWHRERLGNFKVMYVDKLGVRANLKGSSTAPNAQPDEMRFW